MIKPEQTKSPRPLIKTTRQWCGLLVVIFGAIALLLDAITVFPV
jgi:hypothetical protein